MILYVRKNVIKFDLKLFKILKIIILASVRGYIENRDVKIFFE